MTSLDSSHPDGTMVGMSNQEHGETVRERRERRKRGEVSQEEAAAISKEYASILEMLPKLQASIRMQPPSLALVEGPLIDSIPAKTAAATHANAAAVRELAALQRDASIRHEQERAENRRLSLWTLGSVVLTALVAIASLIVALT